MLLDISDILLRFHEWHISQDNKVKDNDVSQVSD